METLATYRLLSAPERGALFDRWRLEHESSRQERFARLIAAGDGIPLLVEARQHLLGALDANPAWCGVEADVTQALKSALNGPRLEFRRIDGNASPSLLDKLIEYEAVHEIRSRRELLRRLEADRRCYAFFHAEWPDEPLIFTEIALTRSLNANVRELLDPESPVQPTDWTGCALFYSITNCQPGLRGFAFGNALIVRAIDTLRSELPRIGTFGTLSPIPGFKSWLASLTVATKRPDGIAELVAALEHADWFDDERESARLKSRLLPLCAYYLLHAKRGSEPADSVARFHLANGAHLHRINWLSDLSRAGLARSAGLTANYLYSPRTLQRSRDVYARTRRVRASRRLQRASRHAALFA
jgi:malonyl-CoA decarboxylase